LAAALSAVKYKLLAVDLDGTLLRRDGVVHEVDRVAIARLQAAGVPVTIATGRLYSGSRAVARVACVAGPIACVDGSHIVDARDDRGLFSRALAGAHAGSVRQIIARSGAASFLFAQDSIVHDARGEPYVDYVRSWSPKIAVVEEVTAHHFWEHEEGVHAIVAIGTERQITGAVRELRSEMSEAAVVLSFEVRRSSDMFAMVVRAAGSSKGTAIEWLAAYYGCAPSEVVAVGDWLNDVPMFKVCGRSFAMAQAPEIVKEAATDHLLAHGSRGGGIAEAIERAWGSL
jgi:Cof subfamily protein (haloacid dehalogenase superfamily)